MKIEKQAKMRLWSWRVVKVNNFRIHEYKLTPYFLYAADCCGVETQDIIDSLKKISKTVAPDGIVKFIQISTLTSGKISLVLKNNCYFVETQYQDVLTELLGVIEECHVEIDKDNTNESSLQIFEINEDKIGYFQQQCSQMDYRLIVEYDFRNDTQKQHINIELNPAGLDYYVLTRKIVSLKPLHMIVLTLGSFVCLV